MPRIHVLSDLHVEFSRFDVPLDVVADVTVLAGDTWTRARVCPWPDAEEVFGRPVVMVLGNHDYYGSTLAELVEMRATARERRVKLLECETATIAGVRFLGTTLWTDYRLHAAADDLERDLHMRACERALLDFKMIRSGPAEPTRLTANLFADLHARSLAWLERELSSPFDGPTVVVTHHGPDHACSHPAYRRDILSSAFVSDLAGFIERWQPDLWLSGHTHYATQFNVGRTRVVSNPRGYVGREILEGFDPRLVIEI